MKAGIVSSLREKEGRRGGAPEGAARVRRNAIAETPSLQSHRFHIFPD